MMRSATTDDALRIIAVQTRLDGKDKARVDSRLVSGFQRELITVAGAAPVRASWRVALRTSHLTRPTKTVWTCGRREL